MKSKQLSRRVEDHVDSNLQVTRNNPSEKTRRYLPHPNTLSHSENLRIFPVSDSMQNVSDESLMSDGSLMSDRR